ncbi:RNA-binding family protein [Perilla frutescens var. frutescens]|nr:RNA-binding family protein [Perilla frutescens var. frutescens]
MAAAEDGGAVELDDMKKRLKEMEDEAAALREMQAKVEQEMGVVQDPAAAAANQTNREEVDARVTIRTNKYGQPKVYAYVEFLEVEAVDLQALLLNESELHGRQLNVSSKRTNVPGMKQFRPRRSNPHTDLGHHSWLLHIYILLTDMGKSPSLGYP